MSEKVTCPNCADAALTLAVDQETRAGVYSCEFCKGLWFPGLTLRKFLCCRPLMRRFLAASGDAGTDFKEFNVDTTHLKCSRCTTDMHSEVYSQVEFFSCPQCQALWFGGGTLARILKRYPITGQHSEVLAREMDHARRVLNASEAQAAALQAEHEASPKSYVDFKEAAKDPETLSTAIKDTALDAAQKSAQKAAELGSKTADKLGDVVTNVVKFIDRFRR